MDPTNEVLKSQAQEFGWEYLRVYDKFSADGHGYCVGDYPHSEGYKGIYAEYPSADVLKYQTLHKNRRWIRTFEESMSYQGFVEGFLHPNETGHRAIAETFLSAFTSTAKLVNVCRWERFNSISAKERIYTPENLIVQNYPVACGPVVLSDQHAIWKAGKEIVFSPGFTAEQGTEFHAYIGTSVEIKYPDIYGSNNAIQNAMDSTGFLANEYANNQISKDLEVLEMELFPNPLHGPLNIRVESPETEDGNLLIKDIMGRPILVQPVRLFKGRNTFVFDDLQPPSSGTYLVFLRTSKKQVVKQLIIR